MGGKTNKERISVLETQRDAHEARHTAFEDTLNSAFDRIDKRLEKGESRFDSIDSSLSEMNKSILTRIPSGNPGNSKNGKRDIVIKISVTAVIASGLMALFMWLIQGGAGG